MQGVVFYRNHNPADASAGGDPVAVFQLTDHVLPFLLSALLGEDEQKIENGKDKQHGQPHQPAKLATLQEN